MHQNTTFRERVRLTHFQIECFLMETCPARVTAISSECTGCRAPLNFLRVFLFWIVEKPWHLTVEIMKFNRSHKPIVFGSSLAGIVAHSETKQRKCVNVILSYSKFSWRGVAEPLCDHDVDEITWTSTIISRNLDESANVKLRVRAHIKSFVEKRYTKNRFPTSVL